MLIECSNCGAPLDVEASSTLARCRYCGRTQQLKNARTAAPHTPANWQPPLQWTPPPQYAAPSVPLRYNANKTVSRLVWLIVIITVVTTIVPIAIWGITFAVSLSNFTSQTPKRQPKSGGSEAPGRGKAKVLKVCEQAAKCCELTSPKSQKSCDMLRSSGMASACQRSLASLRRAAKALGKRCD